MVMKLAVSTLFCRHKKFNEALMDIIHASTKFIELTDDGLHALTPPRVERLLELKFSYDFHYALHATFADINIAAFDRFIRDAALRRIETSIRWASALDAKTLVFHPGAITAMEKFSPGSSWKLNLESVRRLLKFAMDYGVSAMIENVPDPFPFLMKSVEDFERFFDEVGLDIKMVLDVGHAAIKGETEQFLERFGDRIGHIHVSDNNGLMDEHLRLGEGCIDWGKTLAAIKAAGFDGWLVVESSQGVEESLQLLKELMD